jgi:glycolate oxidase iron-sulfur subunit
MPPKPARVSPLARDISELLQDGALPSGDGHRLIVAYHAAYSLQHGQQITAPVKPLLAAGPDRKMASFEQLEPDVVATSNIGCAMDLAKRTSFPVVHTVELLDWAMAAPCRRPFLPFHLKQPGATHEPHHIRPSQHRHRRRLCQG